MAEKDGGPAFPIPERAGEMWEGGYPDGLTIRDYFAAQALAGFLSSPNLNRDRGDGLARACYIVADAMLKARG